MNRTVGTTAGGASEKTAPGVARRRAWRAVAFGAALAVVLATAAAPAGMSAATLWPSFGGSSARTGSTPGGMAAALYDRWALHLGGDIHTQPVVDGPVIYCASDSGHYYAVDAPSGGALWDYDAGAKIASTAALGPSMLYFGDNNGILHAVDRNTGKVVWKVDGSGWIRTSPAVEGNLVIGTASDGRVFALDAGKGTKIWEVSLSDIPSTPAVGGGRIVVETIGGRVVALNLADGKVAWDKDLGVSLNLIPAIAGDRVIVGSQAYYGGGVYALSLADGSQIWRFSIQGNNQWSGAAVAGGKVFVGNIGAEYGLDLATGDRLWKYVYPNPVWYETRYYYPTMQAPVASDGRVLVAATYAIPQPARFLVLGAADGTLLWETPLTDWTPGTPPAVAGGVVYVGAYGGYLHALSGITVLYNGAPVVFPDQEPFIRDGRTLVPVRALFDVFGGTTLWDPVTRTATGTVGSTVLTITIDSKTAKVNGKDVTLDVPAQVLNGRTVVPLRFVSENLGATVAFDRPTETIRITK